MFAAKSTCIWTFILFYIFIDIKHIIEILKLNTNLNVVNTQMHLYQKSVNRQIWNISVTLIFNHVSLCVTWLYNMGSYECWINSLKVIYRNKLIKLTSNLNFPIGGCAYGMPKNFSITFPCWTCSKTPLTLPYSVCLITWLTAKLYL